MAAGLLDQALAAASNVDFVTADGLLAEATAIAPGNKRLSEASERIAQFKVRRVNDLIERAELALKARDRQRAETLRVDLRAPGLEPARVEDLATRVSNAAIYASYQPGEKFADAFDDRSGDGPNMVVIPIGEFLMGSADNEPQRQANEGPQRLVRIERPFALAKTEITVAQFRKFITATKHVTDAEQGNESSVYDNKTGRITRQGGVTWKNDYLGGRAKSGDPVIHVSWNDAQAYADWLATITGHRYRLPSEAEFEYALRAGTTTPYWWGEGSPEAVVGNLTGEGDRSRTKRSWTKAFPRYRDGYWGPAPVGQFTPNPFGLFDLGSNVTEWVEDCWHANFLRAPETGEAWVNRGCTGRTLKGGSWGSSPEDVRSAFRMGVAADTRSARIGFRVARDMAP
ncbi:MAG: formylglycine-generating enzyme family protein [Ahniella sp.]|nr:formylglycine-generating enzyme family protein [Ahniella sp.]